MPNQAVRGSRRPDATAISPLNTAWVATSAVAEATEVSLTDGTQVPKCRARNSPATAATVQPRRSRPANSRRCRSPVSTPVLPAPSAFRQNAMASAGAAVAAMIGPEAETPASATASRPASRAGGRTSDSLGCGTGDTRPFCQSADTGLMPTKLCP